MRKLSLICFCFFAMATYAQDSMTPDLLWKLGRVEALGISKDSANVVFTVTTPNVAANTKPKKTYFIPIKGGAAKEIADSSAYVKSDRISPDGRYKLSAEDVKMRNVSGKDFYADLTKSNAQIYDQLGYRHWDEWEDGAYSHVFVTPVGATGKGKDIMAGQPYDCPQKPFGSNEDFIWSPEGNIVYVTKPKVGTAYALSTNTDIFSYNPSTGTTSNLTAGMEGYDVNPSYSPQGKLAWLSMKREGYEADKQDIIVNTGSSKINLTASWDGSVEGFKWSTDGRNLYFYAPVDGTLQLFVVDYPGITMKVPEVRQVTNGDFDVSGIVGQVGNTLVVTRTDMNHAAELYAVDLSNGSMTQFSHVNDAIYSKLALSKIERKYITTTDNKKMLVWMIYPPNFDASKKYPTLLYCQGGAAITANSTLFFQMELSTNGGERLHHCCAQPSWYVRAWSRMERSHKQRLGRAGNERLSLCH